MKNKRLLLFLLLCFLFLGYSFSIYLFPYQHGKNTGFDLNKSVEGRLVWQRYNCQACHQLYGLGGYLGPDLSNTVSAPNKGPEYIKAMLGTGIKQMPVFKLSETEKEQLIEFLRAVDASGEADPRKLKTTGSGMIE